ncbi:DUF542 domain-containing protein [Mesorhizobium sp. Root157]|uniref:DUF542 domain-containing protein n=1 Tax=Mesorhizobium sp. Root157 TaxID=1736477 RepID=UPI000AB872CF|nr:DUF542 domain-containing protein [Mesorhizobium sp. Root157]
MTTQAPQAQLRTLTVGDIAAKLPGATAVFRSFKIDFCCNGDLMLTEAAQKRGIDVEPIEQARPHSTSTRLARRWKWTVHG